MADRAPLLSQEMMQPTRQQLDDLEALITQMLTLPVSPAPEELLAESTAAPIAMPHAESLELAGAQPLSMGASGLEAFFTEPGRSVEQRASSEAETATTNLAAETPVEADELPASTFDAPWLLRPLVWMDRAFMACTGRLGGAGRWLERGGGRAVVGATGLVMLGTAIAWGILDWIRWSR